MTRRRVLTSTRGHGWYCSNCGALYKSLGHGAIAATYRVGYSTVRDIARGATWRVQ